ncbi:MAG: hypothetical protein IJ113_02125 [Eggerthellaceae bacterium]|nr:hypothetical protein [Eggerthellaceae bacterium]
MMFASSSEDYYSKMRKSAIAKATTGQKELLRNLGDVPERKKSLRVLQRNKQYLPNKGDIFTLSPRPDAYLFGQVLEYPISLDKKDYFFYKRILVVIFDSLHLNHGIDEWEKVNTKNLLTPPLIVGKTCWEEGVFQTIGNRTAPSTCSLGVGFGIEDRQGFVDVFGEPIAFVPQFVGLRALTTPAGVSYEVERAFILNPSLLKTKQGQFPVWGTTDYFAQREREENGYDVSEAKDGTEPFLLHEMGDRFVLTLHVEDLTDYLKEKGTGDDLSLNGYDIESCAERFIIEHSEYSQDFLFDSEADSFCVASNDVNGLKRLAKGVLGVLNAGSV